MTAAQLRTVQDPAERARRALAAEQFYLDGLDEIRAVRIEAIAEMRRQSQSYGQIAKALGITRARVQQLAKKEK